MGVLLCFPRVEDLNCEARLTVAHPLRTRLLDRFAHDFLQYSCFNALYPCCGSRYDAKKHLGAIVSS